MMKSASTEMVKNFAAANGIVKKKEARESLGLSSDQTKYAFDNLVKGGYLRRIDHGLYQFCELVQKPGIEGVDKIWRAMQISTTFSAAEIARLASSSTAYVYKRFRQYRADGYLKEAGVKRTYGSGQEKLWRLTLKGKNKAQAPNVEAFEPDPLVMATVNLNRLICSGFAFRSKDTATQALEHLDIIKKGLSYILEEG